jgi:hypothetical protein
MVRPRQPEQTDTQMIAKARAARLLDGLPAPRAQDEVVRHYCCTLLNAERRAAHQNRETISREIDYE